MTTNFEPSPVSFSFLDLLDQTFRLYRRNFSTMIGVTAIVLIPASGISFLLGLGGLATLTSTGGSTSSRLFGASALSCLSVAAALFFSLIEVVLINGPLTYVASESVYGRRTPIDEAFMARSSRYAGLGCSLILFYGILIVMFIVIAFVTAVCFPALAGVGVVGYIGVAVYPFLIPVMMLENVELATGVSRAWSLGKARFWTIIGLWAALGIITNVIRLAFTGLLTVFTLLAVNPRSALVSQVITFVLSLAISIFITPVIPIGLTLLYLDTRNRLEGLDFALQALDRPDPHPFDVESPLPQVGLTNRDWRNLGIIVGGLLVIVLAGAGLVQSFINTLVPPGAFNR